MFAGILSSFADLLAPRCCPGCDTSMAGEEPGFCDACAPLLEPSVAEGALPKSAFVYAGPMADAIRRFKYDRRTDIVPALSSALADAVISYAGRVDVVIPVPLHAKRMAERGFNQAALLARPAARSLGVPFRPRWLVRVRVTRPQAMLDPLQRSTNVLAAFRAGSAVRDQRVLLIDDVRTTGATFASASEALRIAGAKDVFAVALAKAP